MLKGVNWICLRQNGDGLSDRTKGCWQASVSIKSEEFLD